MKAKWKGNKLMNLQLVHLTIAVQIPMQEDCSCHMQEDVMAWIATLKNAAIPPFYMSADLATTLFTFL